MKTLATTLFLLAGGAAAFGQTLYTDHGNPTPAEQHVLEVINRARANPFAEGTRLGIDITENSPNAPLSPVGVRPPLAMNAKLLAAARLHSQDMFTRAFFAHVNPSGADPGDRCLAQGYTAPVGENIAIGTGHTPAQLEDILMIDLDYPGRGHRVNLLDIWSPPYYREIGVGYFHDNTGVNIPSLDPPPPPVIDYYWKDFLTQDFGRPAGIFLVGVVRDDGNNNDFYDIGEGIAGVEIIVVGNGFKAVTGTAGGFAIPLTVTGTVTVTATGGTLPGTITKQITIGTENVKLDFEKQDIADSDLDGMPDNWENAHGLNPNSNDAGGDLDTDGFTNLEEFQGDSDPQSNTSVPPGDKDGDGMTNPWEVAHGLNPLVNDASGDPDADGFTNLEEFQGNGDPQSNASAPAGDKDGDGMPNPWEVQYNLNPFANDANLDTDGDSVVNIVEYQGGSNPQDPNSLPEEEEDDKLCGCLGIEFLLPLGLAFLRRRRP